MRTDVIVTIKGLQAFDDIDDENVELVTAGRFYHKEGKYYLTYKESELTGLGNTTTTLNFEKNRVTVMRVGDTQSHMVFEEGQKHISYYNTGIATFTVGVSTRSIRQTLDEKGGQVMIDYAMEINNSLTGENAFSLDIRQANALRN
ncbi:MAG: DUF1934 domain-containing protein [Clostridiales bacterium]|nr:DUF1934 domain-containing protein [Clostridiales bacterium]